MAEFGYAGEILKVDLSTRGLIRENTADYSRKYLGGRGFAAKLFWDMVPPEAKGLDPENCIIFTTGPTTGFFGIAGCRWQVCGKSPLHDPEAFSYGNLGGKWGPALKAAGFDAVAVQGKAERPVYIYIRDGAVQIRDASALWGKGAFDTMDAIRAEVGQDVSVAAIGPGGENQIVYATVLADEGASGGGGMGAVMGSKNLKAIAVAGSKSPVAADPARLKQIEDRIKYFRGPQGSRIALWAVPGVTFKEDCYGCSIGCSRHVYNGADGRKYKSFCQQTTIYARASDEYHKGQWDEVRLKALRLCDSYTLDSGVMAPLVNWLLDCYKEGVITEAQTGLPLAKIGTAEFIEKLTHMIAFREGFGEALARGLNYAAESIGPKAVEIMWRWVATRSYEARDYDPRLFITTALFYATEPRRPIAQLHGVSRITMTWSQWQRKMPDARFSTADLREAAQRWWGGEIAADFSTYQGKAQAAKLIQDAYYAKDSLILCDLMYPLMSINSPGDHVGDPTLENQIYSAITGRETDREGLLVMGERICNLLRAINLRMGWKGRQDDVLLDYFHTQPLKKGEVFINPDTVMPGKNGELVSRVGAVVDRDQFEQMKTDYYRLRGWDVKTGYPTKAKLEELGLADIVPDLAKRGLVG